MSVFIIAEAGVNHNGSMKIAKQLIDVAVNSGADAVKFQTFNADRQVTHTAKKARYQEVTTQKSETHYDMLRKLELSEEMHVELMAYCHKKNILFLSSPFDIESVDLLANLGQKCFKVPSGEKRQ
jgi:N,N'-diacetyllegionaminate synthase